MASASLIRAFKDRGEEAEEFDDGEPVPDEDAFSVRGAHADEEAYHGVLQDEPVLSAQEIKRDEPEDPKLQFSRHEEESVPLRLCGMKRIKRRIG